MTNKAIRKKAWKLFTENYGAMLPIMAVVSAISLVPALASALWGGGAAAKTIISALASALIAPVSVCGVASFALGILDGEAPRMEQLFIHLRDCRRLFKIWTAALVVSVYSLAFSAVSKLVENAAAGEPSNTGAALLLVALLAASIVGIWLSTRMALYGYAVARAPQDIALHWLGTSWRAMKRHVRRMLRLEFSVFWPLFIPLPFVQMIFRRMGESGMLSPAMVTFLPSLVNSAIFVFYTGYVNLSMAAFADDRLNEADYSLPAIVPTPKEG